MALHRSYTRVRRPFAAGVLACGLIAALGFGAPAGAAERDPWADGGADEPWVVPEALALRGPAGEASEGLSTRLAALSSASLRDESEREQAAALSLRRNGAGSLMRDGAGIVVSARIDSITGALLARLREAGGELISVNRDYLTVDLAVAPADLRALAGVAGVEAVTEAIEPIVGSAGAGRRGPRQPLLNTCTGSVVSEADAQMRAGEARAGFDIDGLGTKVGLVSDSFDTSSGAATHAAQDVLSGDLPGPGNPCGRGTPVQVLAERPDGSDEGRAMAQLVHDLAPGAGLAFATSGTSAEAMADNIRALRAAGSSVIVDDVTFFDEPMYQDGPISNAVNEVVGAGVPYFSSAANSNVISQIPGGISGVAGQNIGSYEAPAYRPTGCPVGSGLPGTCMDFVPAGPVDSTFAIALAAGRSARFDFQWAQPRNGVNTDFDIYAVDQATSTLLGAGATDNLASQKPFEVVNFQNPTASTRIVEIVINRFSGAATPRLKMSLLGGGGVIGAEFDVSFNGDTVGPTIFGHNGAANAVSTAAVPFDDASSVERFSARGPVTLLFGPVGGSAPAAPLAAPQVLSKPDIAATDGGRTTFFTPSSGSVFRFFGTSAAAPHAAAVAALQLDAANGALTVDQLRAAQTSTASPVGSFGADAAGAGLINAAAAVGANPPQPPLTTITKRPKNKTTKRKATYRFTSNAPEATFKCKVDKRRYRPCDSTAKVKRLDFGKHKFSVKAVANGLTGPAAKDKFKRRR